jgi:hypothetical protein
MRSWGYSYTPGRGKANKYEEEKGSHDNPLLRIIMAIECTALG